MLTIFKQIFTWWNQQTFGTRLQIFFSGKLVGKDENGNKYYESKSGRRWVIYNGEVEASKIPNEELSKSTIRIKGLYMICNFADSLLIFLVFKALN